jgi:hypothetical protein
MNILPLVLSSILILAIGSAALFREGKSTHLQEYCYSGFMKAERQARSEMVKRNYDRIKKKQGPEKKKPGEKKSPPDETFVSRKERSCITELSSLNISSLFTSKSPILYEISAKLIRALYKEAPFFKEAKIPQLEYRLLDSMIAKAKANKKAIHLWELSPDEEELQPIFYKMLKGTHFSYPSLGDYITFDRNKERKAINFSFASTPLLAVLFSDAGAQAILDEEYKLWEKDHRNHRLSDNALLELLQEVPDKPFDLGNVKNHLDFTTKSPLKKMLIGKDDKTQITVKKEI